MCTLSQIKSHNFYVKHMGGCQETRECRVAIETSGELAVFYAYKSQATLIFGSETCPWLLAFIAARCSTLKHIMFSPITLLLL